MQRDIRLSTIIVQNLIENEQLPYILKIENENYLMDEYKNVVKHHITVQELMRKLIDDKYESPTHFKNDLDLMWNNLDLFFPKNTETVQAALVFERILKLLGIHQFYPNK